MEWQRDWPEIIGALATSAAVIVAVLGLWRESRARTRAEARATAAEAAREADRERADHERAELRLAEREARHQAQALQVIAWVERRPATQVRHDSSGERQLKSELVLRFVNQSPSPLFDLKLAVYASGYNEQTEVATIAVVPGHHEREVIPPDELQRQDRDFSGVVLFRDLRGSRWRRHQNGYLQELDEYERPK